MQGTSKQKMKGRNVKAMVGEKNALVIMVEFPNQKFTHSRQEFADMLNEPGYSKNGHIGSAKDYFAAQSYGKLSLNFTVVGPYMVSRESTYYGKDDNGVHDVKAHEMVREAIKLAKNDVDYKLFDWDGDGEVDNVMVIYAGYGGNAKSDEPDYLWPQRHYFSLNGGIEQISNLMFDSYCYVNEITETKDGDLMSGIGTACHEFSHTLGLSDVYYEERKDTPLCYDIMDQGAYNGPNFLGGVPCGYSAWERWMMGWLDFTELKEPTTVEDMPALSDKPVAYIFYNDNNANEYFILENRQKRDFFQYYGPRKASHGLYIMHVNYNASAWLTNNVNELPNPPRYTFIPSGHEFGTDNDAQALFPSKYGVTEFTSTSHTDCGGKYYNPNSLGTYSLQNQDITEISETNGYISFLFDGGDPSAIKEVTTPDASAATYDIFGRQVNSQYKGIIIKQGKKIVR